MNVEHTTAAGFIEFDVEFKPLTLEDWGKLNVWLQDKFRKDCYQTMRELGLSPREHQDYLVAVLRASAMITTGTPEGKEQLYQIDGLLKLMESSCRKAKTTSELLELIKNQAKEEERSVDNVIEVITQRIIALDPEPVGGSESDETEDPTDPTET